MADENRDINIHHIEHEEIKRQRIQYNGDQHYPNVSFQAILVKISWLISDALVDLVIEVVREGRAAAETHVRLNRQPRHLDINTPAQQ